MANSLTAASPTYWSANAGIKLYKTIIFRAITDFSEESLIKNNGRIVDRPYRADVVGEDYTKGTALTAQDLTYSSDQLTLNKLKALLMYVDDVDKLQNKYNTVRLWAEEAGRRLGIIADGDILYEAWNAQSANEIDASELGGTATEGISLTTSNVAEVFGEINEILDNENVPDDERYLVISSLFRNKLWQYIGGKESQLGDKTGETGNIGQYAGLKLYKSTNSTSSARWTPADNPTDEDTITVEGITFTFQSVIGAVAGNILQTTSLAVTIDNIVALINAGGVGDDTNYVSLSTANQRTVQNWVAVDGATYLEIRFKGVANPTTSGSESADTWDAKYEIQSLLFGRKNGISAAIQTDPMVDVAMASTVSAGKRGTNVLPLLVYGVKTFNQGTKEIGRLEIRTDS